MAETGICLELHENLNDCPHFHVLPERQVTLEPSLSPLQDTLAEIQAPRPARQFHAGMELGMLDAAEIMRMHYAYLIGILGSTNVGKTCFLSSLYLMASQGRLMPDYLFAGSLTLQGFEDRVRCLRKWEQGNLPSTLAEHTRLQDPRNPAFMHLALYQSAQGKRLDLLLPDLPGEWTTDLIHRVETASRFDFLRRADGIILVIEGPLLDKAKSRHNEIQNAKLVLERLLYNVGIDQDIPLILLVSKCDLLDMKAPIGVTQIKDYATELGFKPIDILAAAFSNKPNESGTGILDAIKAIIDYNWPLPASSDVKNLIGVDRAFGRFRLA